ncbi:peroxiredoxin family protein [Longispora fulva]|nr:MauE/DoxX family redox-associated membrane protein [Longispora fulva]
MGYVDWVARLAVAAVFGLAMWGKVVDLAGTRRSLAEFGVPGRWVRPAAFALPAAEAAVALGVLLAWSAGWAAGVAGFLLLVFSAVVGGLLSRGRRPRCACFGAAAGTPISAWVVARNAVIAVPVGIALWGSWTREAVPGVPVDHAVGLAALAVVAATLVWQGAVVRSLRLQLDEKVRRELGPEGLPVDAVAPEFDLPATGGGRGTLDGALAAGLPVAVVFVHPGCRPCEDLAGELPRWRQRRAGAVTMLVIGSGAVDANAAWAAKHGVGDILVQDGNEIAARYRVRGAPSAVLVTADGRIGAPVAGGPLAIRDLLATRAGARSRPTG